MMNLRLFIFLPVLLLLCFSGYRCHAKLVRAGMPLSGADLIGLESYKYGKLDVTVRAPTCSGTRFSLILEASGGTHNTNVELSLHMYYSQAYVGFGIYASQGTTTLYDPIYTDAVDVAGELQTYSITWTPTQFSFLANNAVMYRRNVNDAAATFTSALLPVDQFTVAMYPRLSVYALNNHGGAGFTLNRCLPQAYEVTSVSWSDYSTASSSTPFVLRWTDSFGGGALNTQRWGLQPRYFAELTTMSLAQNIKVRPTGGLVLTVTHIDYFATTGIVKAQDFKFTNEWSLTINSPASASTKFTDGCSYTVTVANPGTGLGNIAIQQDGVELVQGHGYMVKFAVRSSIVRTAVMTLYSVPLGTTSASAAFGEQNLRLLPTISEFAFPFVWDSGTTTKGTFVIFLGKHPDESYGAHTIDLIYLNVTGIKPLDANFTAPASITDVLEDPNFEQGILSTKAWRPLTFEGGAFSTSVISGIGTRVDITSFATAAARWHMQIAQNFQLRVNYTYSLYFKATNLGNDVRKLFVAVFGTASVTYSGEHYLVIPALGTRDVNITFSPAISEAAQVSIQFGLPSMSNSAFAVNRLQIKESPDVVPATPLPSDPMPLATFVSRLGPECDRVPKISSLRLSECGPASTSLQSCFSRARDGTGQSLTVTGRGWGYQAQPQLQVTLLNNGPACTPITFVNETVVICVLATSAATASDLGPWPVRVTDVLTGNYSTDVVNISYSRPVIVDAVSSDCTHTTTRTLQQCSANATITLVGSGFDTAATSANVVTLTGAISPPPASITGFATNGSTTTHALVKIEIERGGEWSGTITTRSVASLQSFSVGFAQPPPQVTQLQLSTCNIVKSGLALYSCTSGTLGIVGRYFDTSGMQTIAVTVTADDSSALPSTITASCDNVRVVSSTTALCELVMSQYTSAVRWRVKLSVGSNTASVSGTVTSAPVTSFASTIVSASFLPYCEGGGLQITACSAGVLVLSGTFPAADTSPQVVMNPSTLSCSVLTYNTTTIMCFTQPVADTTHQVSVIVRNTASKNTASLVVKLTQTSESPIATAISGLRCLSQPKPTTLESCVPTGAITIRGISLPSTNLKNVVLSVGTTSSMCSGVTSNVTHIVCTPKYEELLLLSNGPWVVKLQLQNDQIVSTDASFTLDTLPVITDLSMATCTIKATLYLQGCSTGILTITGRNFGSTKSQAEVSLTAGGSLYVCPMTGFSSTRIECELTITSLINVITLTVKRNSLSSENSVAYVSPQQQVPTVLSMALASCWSTTLGTTVLCAPGVLTVYGKNFNTNNPTQNLVSFSNLSPEPTCNVISADAEKLLCNLALADSLVGSGHIHVKVFNLTSVKQDSSAVTVPTKPVLYAVTLLSQNRMLVTGRDWVVGSSETLLHVRTATNCTIQCVNIVWSPSEANCTLRIVGSECSTNATIAVTSGGRLSNIKWIFFQGASPPGTPSIGPATPLVVFTTARYSVNAFPLDQFKANIATALVSTLQIVSASNVKVYSVCQAASVPGMVKERSCIHYENVYHPNTFTIQRRLLAEGDTVVGFLVQHSSLSSTVVQSQVLSALNTTFDLALRGQGVLSWMQPTSSLSLSFASSWPTVKVGEQGGVILSRGLLTRRDSIPYWTWILLSVTAVFLFVVTFYVLAHQDNALRRRHRMYNQVREEKEMIQRHASAQFERFTSPQAVVDVPPIEVVFTIHVSCDGDDTVLSEWGISVQGAGVHPDDRNAVTQLRHVSAPEGCPTSGTHTVRLTACDGLMIVVLARFDAPTVSWTYALQPKDSLEVWLSTSSSKVHFTPYLGVDLAESSANNNNNMNNSNVLTPMRRQTAAPDAGKEKKDGDVCLMSPSTPDTCGGKSHHQPDDDDNNPHHVFDHINAVMVRTESVRTEDQAQPQTQQQKQQQKQKQQQRPPLASVASSSSGAGPVTRGMEHAPRMPMPQKSNPLDLLDMDDDDSDDYDDDY